MPPMLSQSSKISPALPLTPKCFYNIAPPQVRGQGLLLRFLLIKVFAAELESSSSSSSWHYVNSCHLESPNSFRRDESRCHIYKCHKHQTGNEREPTHLHVWRTHPCKRWRERLHMRVCLVVYKRVSVWKSV